ncbi:hypothetical protein ACJX0J_011465 [Zea mays]
MFIWKAKRVTLQSSYYQISYFQVLRILLFTKCNELSVMFGQNSMGKIDLKILNEPKENPSLEVGNQIFMYEFKMKEQMGLGDVYLIHRAAIHTRITNVYV